MFVFSLFICHWEEKKKCSSAVPFRNNCFLLAGQTAALALACLLWKQHREQSRVKQKIMHAQLNLSPKSLLSNCLGGSR